MTNFRDLDCSIEGLVKESYAPTYCVVLVIVNIAMELRERTNVSFRLDGLNFWLSKCILGKVFLLTIAELP